MQKKFLMLTAAVVFCLAAVLTAGCVSDTGTTGYVAAVDVVQIPAAQQISSLSLGTVDAMVNWQPFVAASTVSGIGKVVSYSQDMPRADGGSWAEHTCCVFGANKQGLENEDLATTLTGLMLAANDYITENPDDAAVYVADWMYGNTDPEYGGKTVKGVDILKASLPTIKFSTEVTDTWKNSNYEFLGIQRDLGAIVKNLKSTSKEETEELIYDFTPYTAAKKILDEKSAFPTPTSGEIEIGYLLSDHDAPLFVLIKNWQYFKDNYNAYLKPVSEKAGAVDKAELYVNGEKVCNVKLVQGNGGPYLMTMLQSNSIQFAVAGTPPFLSSIDTQTGLKILAPIMTEGSGLVVSKDAPANNWDEFVAWAKEASASGKNLVVAIPQTNSIQDVQLKSALESANIEYKVKSV
ncbi:MAG TPA: ABC transporter substrate-binding protein [Methanocorpusculum sp.]|nr:ABC transporter substrate-binding protein [Methanocorpusculum sp.]